MKEKKTIVVVVDKELKDEVEVICRRIGASVNSFIVSAIREKIQKTKKLIKQYERENI